MPAVLKAILTFDLSAHLDEDTFLVATVTFISLLYGLQATDVIYYLEDLLDTVKCVKWYIPEISLALCVNMKSSYKKLQCKFT